MLPYKSSAKRSQWSHGHNLGLGPLSEYLVSIHIALKVTAKGSSFDCKHVITVTGCFPYELFRY